MNKFEDVDVITSLEAIMKQNTAFYQNDFDLDRNILQKAAASPTAEDRRLLWFSRPSGTSCFRERDVFLKGTRQHNTWRFYGEQTRDKVLAYAVELTGIVNGKIKGNLYELDYPQHFRHVKEQALPADNYTLLYEHGERVQPAGQYLDGNPDPQLGKFERFEAQPNDPEALHFLMREEKRSYDRLKPGDFKAHITALHDSRIEAEAQRIVAEMKRQDSPNSPNKTHFMVELSPYFMQLASTKDTDRLFAMLPYKTLSFSKIEGRHGTFAFFRQKRGQKPEYPKSAPLCPGAAYRRQENSRPEKGSGKKKKSRFGGMSMNRFTVEETNLLSIYHEGSKAQLIEDMTAALPYMDAGLRELAKRTLSKVGALTEAEYRELAVYPADEV